jgi:hypothetical protein
MGVIRYLSWSHSRSSTYATCPRAYFFEYLSREDPGFEGAPLLARLKSPEQLTGIIVDRCVKAALKRTSRGQTLPTDAVDRVVQALALQFANSPVLAGQMHQGVEPRAGSYVLVADYYGQSTEPRTREVCLDKAKASMGGFLQSSLFERLSRCQGETLRFTPPRVPTFKVDQVSVFASYDAMLVSQDKTLPSQNKVLILDWKSGRRCEESETSAWRQLGIYASYALAKKLAPLEKIYVQAAWLRHSPQWDPQPISKALVSTASDRIRQESTQIGQQLRRGFDLHGMDALIADRESFPPTPHHRKCSACRFQKLCPERAIGFS